MALFKQSSTAYRLNYLWYTKQEIASAINEVGKNKGISVNPRQDFAKFAEKILKLQTSVWSSAFIKVEPVGNENPRAEHWFEYIDEYFQPSEDIAVDPSKQYYKQPPHALTITENGYYKVSDLSLREFGEADAKTVASSFYVSVQSAPIIIGNNHLEYGTITDRGTKSPVYNFNETFTGDIPTILTQLMSRLGIVMGVQAVKEGTNWTATFDNGKVMIFSESGDISTPSGLSLGNLSGSTITVKIIKNTKAIYFTTSDGLTYSAGKSFVLATTDNNEDAAWINIGDGESIVSTMNNLKAIVNGEVFTASGNSALVVSGISWDYSEQYDEYVLVNMSGAFKSGYSCIVDFGENLFLGPKPGRHTQTTVPASFKLGYSEFAALLDNSCFWQRLS